MFITLSNIHSIQSDVLYKLKPTLHLIGMLLLFLGARILAAFNSFAPSCGHDHGPEEHRQEHLHGDSNQDRQRDKDQGKVWMVLDSKSGTWYNMLEQKPDKHEHHPGCGHNHGPIDIKQHLQKHEHEPEHQHGEGSESHRPHQGHELGQKAENHEHDHGPEHQHREGSESHRPHQGHELGQKAENHEHSLGSGHDHGPEHQHGEGSKSHGPHQGHEHRHSIYTPQEADIISRINRIEHLIVVPFTAMKTIYARILYLPIGAFLLNTIWFLFIGILPTVFLVVVLFLGGLLDHFLPLDFFSTNNLSIIVMFLTQISLNLVNFLLLSNILRNKNVLVLVCSIIWNSLAFIPGAYIAQYLENLPYWSRVHMNLLGRFVRDCLITIGLGFIIQLTPSKVNRTSSSQFSWPLLTIIFFHVTSCLTHLVERPTLEKYANISERNNYELANNALQIGFLGVLDFMNYVAIMNENDENEGGTKRQSFERWMIAGRALILIGSIYVFSHFILFRNILTIILALKLVCLYLTHAGFFSSLKNTINFAIAIVIFPLRNLIFMYALVNMVNSIESFYMVLLLTEGTLIFSNGLSYIYQLYKNNLNNVV